MAVAFLALLLVSSAGRADASDRPAHSLPGNTFPVTQSQFYLSGTTGSVAGQSNVFLLQPSAPAQQGMQTFLLPGVSVLNVINQPSTMTWYSQTPFDKDLEVVNDSVTTLYFQANAQGLAVFTVSLYDVAPNGMANLVDSDEQQFATALSATPIHFPLHTAGIVLLQGHILGLQLAAQTANAAVFLQYGGTTPSALDSLATRWLDSDGDGVPDSDEIALGRNPLNPNDPTTTGKDTDKDGLSDELEHTIGTDPNKVDTDGDGFGDGLEVYAGTNPLDPHSFPYDVNHNGLPDSFETTYFNNTTVVPTVGPCTPGPSCIDPHADPDGDGCDNLCEATHGTNPNNPDTDGDGVNDGTEIAHGSDPLSPKSVYVGARGVPEPVATGAAFASGSTICLLALLRRP